jgi:heme oxygenase
LSDTNLVLGASVLSRVRAETRTGHDAVERTLMLMNADLTLDHYSDQLDRLYGCHKPTKHRMFGTDSPWAAHLTLVPRKKTCTFETWLRWCEASDES